MNMNLLNCMNQTYLSRPGHQVLILSSDFYFSSTKLTFPPPDRFSVQNRAIPNCFGMIEKH